MGMPIKYNVEGMSLKKICLHSQPNADSVYEWDNDAISTISNSAIITNHDDLS